MKTLLALVALVATLVASFLFPVAAATLTGLVLVTKESKLRAALGVVVKVALCCLVVCAPPLAISYAGQLVWLTFGG